MENESILATRSRNSPSREEDRILFIAVFDCRWTNIPSRESQPMKIAVASDHRGFCVKARILSMIANLGHQGLDFGPESGEVVDYPDYASRVGQAVSRKEVDRGILICGSGMGMCIVANKYDGVRAAPCHDDLTAEMSRLHNDSNVLCLSADLLGERLVNRMVDIWLSTEFEGGRHSRRLEKIAEIEAANHRAAVQ